MANIICINCMKGTLNEKGICSACGKSEDAVVADRRYLPPRTILRGKYLIGQAIGGGGFGITYLAYDLDLEIRVAIKEFFPRDFVGRDTEDRLTLLPYEGDCGTIFEAEKEKFINEAKRLAKFRGKPGIVSVLDYFQENGTAYIVMEYIDGSTLKAFHKAAGAALDVEKVLNLMKPVIAILDMVHAEGIIHRDISPDNIMINIKEEKVYLIDFGTAREADADGERSLSVYMKHGYTPVEQRSRHGVQGPWTDVYALCATIYRCITKRYVPEANDRILGEELVKPSDIGIAISPQVEAALLHGLAIKPEERIRSMAQLMQELYEDGAEAALVHSQEEEHKMPHYNYKTAVVKKASGVATSSKTYSIKEESVEPWKSKLACFIIVCIGILAIVYGLNMTYRKDSNSATSKCYSMVDLEWGKPYRVDIYSGTGKKVASTSNFMNSEGEKIVATSLSGDEEDIYVPYCSVRYQNGKIVEVRNGNIIATVTEYHSETNFKIEWWDKGKGSYEDGNTLIGTTTVQDGICKNRRIYSDSGLTGIVEYQEGSGLTVKFVNKQNEEIRRFEFKDDERGTFSYYAWTDERHYQYQFFDEDRYSVFVMDGTKENLITSYLVHGENVS